MANDRLMMRCRKCEAQFMMAKYYPSNRGVWWRDELCDFIDEHMEKCVPRGIDLNGNRVFDLFTENTTSEQAAAKMEIVRHISSALTKWNNDGN